MEGLREPAAVLEGRFPQFNERANPTAALKLRAAALEGNIDEGGDLGLIKGITTIYVVVK